MRKEQKNPLKIMGRCGSRLSLKLLHYSGELSTHVKTHNVPLSNKPHEQRTCKEPWRHEKIDCQKKSKLPLNQKKNVKEA